MKLKLVFGALGALVALTVTAAEPVAADAAAKPRKSLREKIAERQALAGGMVEAPVTGQVIRVVNDQTRLSVAELEAIVARIRAVARLPIVLDGQGGGELQGRLDAREGAVLLLTERPGYPRVLVAPENAWSAVNVAQLAADEPASRRLAERTEKEMWRALCMSLGASNAIFQPCLMRTIRSLKDLDYCASEIPSPEPMGKLEDAAKVFGIERLRSVTYKTACFEGWASAPTNDLQRGIYEGVKNGTITPSGQKK